MPKNLKSISNREKYSTTDVFLVAVYFAGNVEKSLKQRRVFDVDIWRENDVENTSVNFMLNSAFEARIVLTL